MVALGMFFMALTWYGFYLNRKGKLENSKRYLKLQYGLSSYIAINAGWIVAEVGRQPWTVYKLMRTAESVSPISFQIWFSLISLIFLHFTFNRRCILNAEVREKGPALEEPATEEVLMSHDMLAIIWFGLWGVIWTFYFILDMHLVTE